jgi:Putative Actinobacterial Holin-X, holin superfamily III
MLSPRPDVGDRMSIGDLLRSLVEDFAKLFRAEVALAKSELTTKAARLATPLAKLLVGALLGLAALLTLIAAFVGWLTPLVGAGWAAFIVAVVVGGVGAALVLSGKAELDRTGFALPRTAESVRRSTETLKGK